MDSRAQNKRRLNFIAGEDFYFLTYQILILLDQLTSSSGSFKDHRKLAYIIQLVSSEENLKLLERYEGRKIENQPDRELLFRCFTVGEMHKREIYKLLWALKLRGLLLLERASAPEAVDITINRQHVSAEILTAEIFLKDRQRALRFKKLIPRLSNIGLETFLQKTFGALGIKVWAI